MNAESISQLAHALDCLLSSLADDIRRTEGSCELDPVGMAAKDDDLLGVANLSFSGIDVLKKAREQAE
jgi:hypothetical protein